MKKIAAEIFAEVKPRVHAYLDAKFDARFARLEKVRCPYYLPDKSSTHDKIATGACRHSPIY